MHVDNRFVANRNGCRRYAVTRDPQQRTGADDVVTAVNAEELQRSAGLGAFLYLVEDQHRFAGDESRGRAQ